MRACLYRAFQTMSKLYYKHTRIFVPCFSLSLLVLIVFLGHRSPNTKTAS